MLVLSRKTKETIVIDQIARIEVIKVKGNTVRLGIKAPSSVKIIRGELSPSHARSKQHEFGEPQTSHEDNVCERFPKICAHSNQLKALSPLDN